MPTVQEHPHYHQGFFDAIEGDPLFDDATAEYKAGWIAWHHIKGWINDDDFLVTPEAKKLPADPRQHQFNN